MEDRTELDATKEVNSPDETGDHQHVNLNGSTDADRGAMIGGIGGAVTGLLAGSIVGPVGAVIGAVVGGVAGAGASKVAVGMVDKHDNDFSLTGLEHPGELAKVAAAKERLDRVVPVMKDEPDQVPNSQVAAVRQPLPGDFGYDKAVKDPNALNPFLGADQEVYRGPLYNPTVPEEPKDDAHVDPTPSPDVVLPVAEDSQPSVPKSPPAA